MTPEITVIVPYYNERETIEFTLQRVAAQTLAPTTAIFINSSSTDDTAAIIDRWIEKNRAQTATRFLNVFEHTDNPASSKNAGVRLATTEWVAFMDCGQNFPADWLALQHQYASEHCVEIVSGVVYLTGKNWVDRCAIAQTYGYRRKRPCLPSSLIRRSVFERTGLLTEGRRAGYDAAWLLRLKSLGITRGINPAVVIEYIGTNFSSNLPHLFRKSIMYAKPSVALPGYHVPYVYAALSVAFLAILTVSPSLALWLFAAYFLARTFAIPLLKSGGGAFFRENPVAAVCGAGVVGLVMDCGRLIGTWQGIYQYHLKSLPPSPPA
jgi:glycosyltransferase involved in cell wall biosynthesis